MGDIFIKAQGNKIPVSNYMFYLTYSMRSDYISNENDELYTGNILHFKNYNIIKYSIDFYKKRKKEPFFDPNKFTEIVVTLPREASKELLEYKDTFHNIVNSFFERYFFRKYNAEHFLNFLHTKDSSGTKLHTHILLYPFTTINNSQRVRIKHFKPYQELEELKEELREFIKKPDSFKPVIKGTKYRFSNCPSYSIKDNFLDIDDNISLLSNDLLKKLENEIKINGMLKIENLGTIVTILDIFKRNFYLAKKNNSFLSILLHYCNNTEVLSKAINIYENVNSSSLIDTFILENSKKRLDNLQKMSISNERNSNIVISK